MKPLLTTTATALLLATSALADSHMMAFSDKPFDAAVNVNASDVLGSRVYATEADVSGTAAINADGRTEWDDIGEINEIVLTRDGTVQSVIVGVGGFLGMGEKDVAVDMSQISFVSDGDNPDDYFLVIKADAAGVTDALAYMGRSNNATDADPTNDTAMDNAERTPLLAPTVARDGYAAAKPADLTAEDLTGARVYGPDDEDIGEISELLLTADGKMDAAVIDIGGFLGIGEHSVSVKMDELSIVRADDGSDLRVYIDSSKEALESLPAYEG